MTTLSLRSPVFLGSLKRASLPTPPPPALVTLATAVVSVYPQAVSLINFPFWIRMADLPVSWWNTLTSINQITVQDANGNSLPYHVVSIDTVNKVGSMWVKATLSSSAPTVINVLVTNNLTANPPSGTYGSNNVWNDYAAVYICDPTRRSATNVADATLALTTDSTTSDVTTSDGGYGIRESQTGTYTLRNTNITGFGASFTMAVTGKIDVSVANAGVLSLYDSYVSGSRATIVFPDGVGGRPIGVWDTNSGWLFSAINAALSTNYRMHAVYSGTSRSFYVDGTNKVTGGQSLVATRRDIYIGTNQPGGGEPLNGTVGFAYLRLSVLSDEWIFAEVTNLRRPGSFYVVNPSGAPVVGGLVHVIESSDFDASPGGTSISSWTDHATTPHNWTLALGGATVDQTNKLNGHATARFPGNSGYTQATWFPGNWPGMHLFAIFSHDSGFSAFTAGAVFQFNKQVVYPDQMPYEGDNNFYVSFGRGDRPGEGVFSTYPQAFAVFEIGTGLSQSYDMIWNGSTKYTTASGAYTYSQHGSEGLYTLGYSYWGGNNYFLPGNVAGLYLFDHKLSVAERTIFYRYLYAKWAIITVSMLASDDLESYANSAALNGLNYGFGWSSGYVDRAAYVGTRTTDSLESYSNGAALNGLNGGTGWTGAFVDKNANVRDWLLRVAAAGGATPSAGTITAVTTFLNGLSSNNLLAKMHSVNCFVPDNLISALTPLIAKQGNASWTNHGFVLGDLSVNGLQGDGVGKYLDTGVLYRSGYLANSSTGNCGASVVLSGGAGFSLGVYTTGSGTYDHSFVLGINSNQGRTWFAVKDYSSFSDFISGWTGPWTGYISGNNVGGTSTVYMANPLQAHGQFVQGSFASNPVSNSESIYVFAIHNTGTATPSGYDNARHSFVALHDGLTSSESATLYTLVNALRTSLGGGMVDPVVAWANRVVAAGGAAPSAGTISAMQTFYSAIYTAGILPKMAMVNVMAPDNLTAAITPLIQMNTAWTDTWTNTGFVSGDLSVDGLKGNGSSKWLDTKFVVGNSQITTASGGLTVYTSRYNAALAADVEMGIYGAAAYSGFALGTNLSGGSPAQFNGLCWKWNGAGTDSIVDTAQYAGKTGYFSLNRTALNAMAIYHASGAIAHNTIQAVSTTQTGVIEATYAMPVFATRFETTAPGSFTSKTISFIAAHQGLTSSESVAFFNAIQALRVALGGGYVDQSIDWSNRVIASGGAAPSAVTVAAMKNFVDGCTTDGLWSKILAVNCFAPDNLTAALTPLMLGAGYGIWTNNSFTSGSLNPFGLVGNGAQYLNTGIKPSVIFTDTSAGVTICVTKASTANVNGRSPIGCYNNTPSEFAITDNWNASGLQAAFNCWWYNSGGVVSGSYSGLGMYSGSRVASNDARLFYANFGGSISQIGSINTTYGARPALNLWTHCVNYNDTTPQGYTDGRISFIALHNGLSSGDTGLLWSRVQTLRNALVVSDWANRVVAAGGAAPSAGTKTALQTFVDGLMTNGLFDSMVAVNCFVPDNLVAACTPLIQATGNASWTNHSFVSGDLSVNGLKGDGSSKYLDTGININTGGLTTTSAGLSLYVSTSVNETNYDVGAYGSGGQPGTFILQESWSGATTFQCYGYTTGFAQAANLAFAGFVSGNLVGSTRSIYLASSTTPFNTLVQNTNANDTSTITTYGLYVFSANNNGSPANYSSKRFSFVAIHQGLTSAKSTALYTLVQALRTSLGGGYV